MEDINLSAAELTQPCSNTPLSERPDTADAAENALNQLSDLLTRLPDPKALSAGQKERERKLLRNRLKAINAVPRSDWHRDFENILQIEIDSWQNGTIIDREVSIGEDAPRADFIMVCDTELPEHVKSVFRIFRRKNAIEYKRPTEALTEKMVWKTAGYGNLLIGTAQGNAFDPNELTISVFAYRKNQAQFLSMLEQGILTPSEVRGIYRVNGLTILPYQIVIAQELEGREYAAYRALSDHASIQDISVILEAMQNCSVTSWDRYFSILQTIETHNRGVVRDMIQEGRNMNTSFFEMFKPEIMKLYEPEILERQNKAVEAATKAVSEAATTNFTERLILRGADGPFIADVTGYDRTHIDSIARRLNHTVSWNEARA